MARNKKKAVGCAKRTAQMRVKSYWCVFCGRFWPAMEHNCDHRAEKTL